MASPKRSVQWKKGIRTSFEPLEQLGHSPQFALVHEAAQSDDETFEVLDIVLSLACVAQETKHDTNTRRKSSGHLKKAPL